jgi:hypothetical protein
MQAVCTLQVKPEDLELTLSNSELRRQGQRGSTALLLSLLRLLLSLSLTVWFVIL